jgi:formylglycine-generating enzyme required for sulfatase activity
MSAIFISYTGRDPEGDAWADRLAGWFQEWNYGYFRDKDHSHGIKAGEEWRPALYRSLGLAQAMVCLCSKQYEGSPWCVGEVAIAVQEGKTVIPIQLLNPEEEAQSQPLPSMLQTRQAIQVADALHPSPEQLEEVRHQLRTVLNESLKWRDLQTWDATLPPYPGLPAFEAEQAPVFFGRDSEIVRVVQQLTSLALSAPGFLLLLGASGYGKSSLVRAGVVPWLRAERQRRWLVLEPFKPGLDPFGSLRSVLREPLAAAELVAQAQDGDGEAAGLSRQLHMLSSAARAPVVLVIDQFEELLADGNQEGERFLAFLEGLLSTALAEVLVLATMRSDFFAPFQSRWPELLGLATTEPLKPIRLEDFGELISGPAKRSNLEVQPGLKERLVADSGGGDALPLLAFTLEKLWQKWRERGGPMVSPRGERWDLTVADYEALGGVAGAVSSQAKLCWNPETGTEADAVALREAFLDHLVTLNEEGQAAKRAAELQELPERSRPIVQRMVNRRLVVSDAGRVEIAHEALLRTWEPLVEWIEAGKVELLQCLRVKRLGEDLKAEADQPRRQALEQLAALAAAGGSDERAVWKEATDALTQLLNKEVRPLADREDAALVLALIGAEEPLLHSLADTTAPVALRRRAAESLGLLARRCGKGDPHATEQRQRIEGELEAWLRSDALNLLVKDAEGWAEHDARLPLLQGASRGLQLAASAGLPLLGSGPGRLVPMLMLTALEESGGLRIRTEVVEVPVWRLPLPGGEQLELVVVPEGEMQLGSPLKECGRTKADKWYASFRDGCRDGIDVEALRLVRLQEYLLVRQPISQAQWREIVVNVSCINEDVDPAPGRANPTSLWESHGQPGDLAVDSVSWNNCQEWLQRLNYWLSQKWAEEGGQGKAPRFNFPSESQWEAACRAGTETPFHFGDTLDATWARYNASSAYGLGRKKNRPNQPWLNGSSGLVNRWGLSEMHGQLNEWCEDSWHPNPIGKGWPVDGHAWRSEDVDLVRSDSGHKMYKLVRGGSWVNDPHDARSAFRYSGGTGMGVTNALNGLRLCCQNPPCSSLSS